MPKPVRPRRYIGVSKIGQRWAANIRVRGKNMHCGTFESAAEAAYHYNQAALEYHGPAARLNKLT